MADRSGSKNEADVTMQVPFMLASYRIDPSTSTLTLTNNLDKLLDKALYDDISSDLMPSLTYEWTGKAFKAKNNPSDGRQHHGCQHQDYSMS